MTGDDDWPQISPPDSVGRPDDVTGFDVTVPPDDDPAHDEAVPALHDDPEPDEPGGEQQAKPADDLAQDDELRAGQWGPTAD